MEIDNYRNFLAIVEAGSMTSASEFVHIAQPALSKQLKSLEGYFGTKLIITTRGSKHLILTDAGKILYHKAKYICSLEDMARIEIDDISDGNRGTLRISAANSVHPFSLRPVWNHSMTYFRMWFMKFTKAA
ncbi:MAG: LysR family transcriptional regulator [Dialister invisus]